MFGFPYLLSYVRRAEVFDLADIFDVEFKKKAP